MDTLQKLMFLHRVKSASGGGVSWETISGTLPLTLLDAAAKPITSLIRYGKVTQDGTPTPASPVDIVCNNGGVRMVHRSGLPSGYKLLEYVGGSGSQYVITDLYLASTDVIECEYCNSSTTGYGAVYGVFKVGESSALYGNQTYYSYDSVNDKVNTGISVDTEWHSSRHDFVNGTLTIDNTTVTFTPFEFVNSTKNAVLSRYYNNNYGYNWKGYVRKFKVTRGNEVVCDLLPAKDSNNVAGLYDLVSGSFYTASAGTLLEGNEVDDYELRVVGTPEVLSVTASGHTPQTASVANLYSVDDYRDEQDVISGVVTRRVGVKVLTGTENWSYYQTSGGVSRFRLTRRIMEQRLSKKSPVVCSHYGTQLDDADGTAYLQSAFGEAYLYICDNRYTSEADFKAHIAEQYAAGTPVIVMYQLAEEVTESVTPQGLSTVNGTNVVSTVANVGGLDGSCEYAFKSSGSIVGTAIVGTAVVG